LNEILRKELKILRLEGEKRDMKRDGGEINE